MRGRPPKPTALKIIQGNPGKRKLNKREPKLDPKEPECPEHLDDFAKEEWARLVPILMRMKVLTEADQIALANLCQTYSTLVRAQAELKDEGLLMKTPSGYVQQNPLLSIVNACISTITKLSGEFGLTPASRVRLHAEPARSEPDNKWAKIGMG